MKIANLHNSNFHENRFLLHPEIFMFETELFKISGLSSTAEKAERIKVFMNFILMKHYYTGFIILDFAKNY
jgi:hypothetical protein